MRLREGRVVRTRAKRFELAAGCYMYIGSAPNLRARVSRHLRRRKVKHWHIDFLLEHAEVLDVLVSARRVEQELALMLCSLLSFVPGFGCSDSRAASHLFLIEPT
ncbi:MAG: DUF123 domain-containing protein [Euryarchaeota archaeon]|nr:DUF123 domain-containing protein [Euryarchaeota archaeon]